MTDPDDIGEALDTLAGNGEPVWIYPPGGAQAVMARIQSVDPELPHFVIELSDENVLSQGECIFVAWLESVKFQFRLTYPQWKSMPGQPGLIFADFPERCLMLNRRASPRLETPLGAYFTASFALGTKAYELQLYDFSEGGVAMRCSPRDAAGLHVGRKLQRVELQLGPDTMIVCDMEIRLSRRFRSSLLGEQVQLGCRFLNLPQPMQDQVQRVVESMKDGRG
ncbi:PilZ domain-containing protein [Herbaspirillum sp. HC18]|nr:PilZ domain-containing protein [Herbaspirillum sp. HC18]